MINIHGFVKTLSSRSLQSVCIGRNIHVTAISSLKQIVEQKEGKTLTIEAVYHPSPRAPALIKLPEVEDKECCSLCKLNLPIKHTDVLILSQFVRSDGCMLSRRVTKLCSKQQMRMSNLVSMAQKSGLMSNLNPPESKKNPKLRRGEKRFNTYWDETLMRPL
uniref:28S ribosomal protein S18a, mitochondrial n=1 Tax=Cacopsylla melanoneura TaxID=428564 RepID=A0A8D8Q099_9HEMI